MLIAQNAHRKDVTLQGGRSTEEWHRTPTSILMLRAVKSYKIVICTSAFRTVSADSPSQKHVDKLNTVCPDSSPSLWAMQQCDPRGKYLTSSRLQRMAVLRSLLQVRQDLQACVTIFFGTASGHHRVWNDWVTNGDNCCAGLALGKNASTQLCVEAWSLGPRSVRKLSARACMPSP